MKSAVIIVPTIGKPELYDCLRSCLNQSYENLHIKVVVDGSKYSDKVLEYINDLSFDPSKLSVDVLTDNVGAGGWYGHRVYAAYSYLVNQDYVFYLDEDNFLENFHVESMVNLCETDKLDWCYSLRKIVDINGNYICNDDCESLGMWMPYVNYQHIDTSCYCLSLKTAQLFCPTIFGKWGQDRIFYSYLRSNDKYHTTGKYSLNYRLGGNDGSVKQEFFTQGNSIVKAKYNNRFPWRFD